MCTVLVPPGGNPIAVNKYVNNKFPQIMKGYRALLYVVMQLTVHSRKPTA